MLEKFKLWSKDNLWIINLFLVFLFNVICFSFVVVFVWGDINKWIFVFGRSLNVIVPLFVILEVSLLRYRLTKKRKQISK